MSKSNFRKNTVIRLIELCGDKIPNAQSEIINIIAKKIENSIMEKSILECNRLHIPPHVENYEFGFVYCGICYNIFTYIENKNEYLENRLVKYASLYQILQETHSPRIAEIIAEFVFPVSKFAELRPEDVNPIANQKYINEFNERLQQKLEEVYCTHYVCPKCGENKTVVKNKQLRRADEGTTDFITCKNKSCGHNWHKYG